MSRAPAMPPPTRLDLAFYRVVRFVLWAFARTFWRLEVHGAERLPPGPHILAPVHRSNIDTVIVATITTRRLRFLGKHTMWKVGWIGRIFTALGGFPVERGTADREAFRKCIDALANGEPLVMFPEGTRQSGPEVQPLFDGPALVASRAQVPIVPVGIGGSEAAMPRGAKMLRPVKVVVVIGEPLPPPSAPSGGRRVPRSALTETTTTLRGRVQALFDEARERAAG